MFRIYYFDLDAVACAGGMMEDMSIGHFSVYLQTSENSDYTFSNHCDQLALFFYKRLKTYT